MEEEEAFPNEDELHVASALLLLSTTHSSSPKVKSISEISQIAALSYATSVSDSKSKSTDFSTVTADDADIHSASPKMKIISETSQIATLSYTASVSDSKSKSTDSSAVTADDNDDSHSASPKVKSISETSQIAALSYATSVSDSKSKSTDSSTVTADDDEDEDDDASFSEAKANARRMKMIRMIRVINKLKAVRRRRSKSLYISDCLTISSGKTKPATSLSTSCTSTSSCVSIDSAAGDISSGGGSYEANRVVLKEKECVPRKMKVIFSAHMRRRAEAILKVLSSHGCASEVRIRQLLGDSPDTSKALRILLRLEEVKRTGAGGRADPYVYVIS